LTEKLGILKRIVLLMAAENPHQHPSTEHEHENARYEHYLNQHREEWSRNPHVHGTGYGIQLDAHAHKVAHELAAQRAPGR
jgi:hypothetical protein